MSQRSSVLVAMLGAAVILTGCSSPEEEPDATVDQDQELTNIGVRLGAPGLITGVDPDAVSGAEVSLAVALSQALELSEDAEDIAWVPTATSQPVEDLEDGTLDLMIGQHTDESLDDEISWVGPYLEVEPALAVRTEQPDDEATPATIATEVVDTLEDLQEASVCVVTGSRADGPELPAADVVVEDTVAACETGMLSGRFDAIAADDAQLAGLLANTSALQMLDWTDLTDEAEDELADDVAPELLEAGGYWIGTPSQHCAETVEALRNLAAAGGLEEAFDPLAEATDYEPQVVATHEITTIGCGTEGG